MPWRLSPPKQLPQQVRRLLGRFGLAGQPVAPGSDPVPVDRLLQAGNTLREAREARGLGLRQLANETRISTAVLEALEKGWRDRLPEAAYLRTMLPLLEHHLQLPGGSLQGAQPPETSRPHEGRGGRVLRFTPGSIDVFTTWQGTVLYGILTLGLIYALNLQQQRLAARGLLTVDPLVSSAETAPEDPGDREQPLLAAFPELKPLRQAAEGQGLRLLRGDTNTKPSSLPTGLLTLQLESPTSMRAEPAGRQSQPPVRAAGGTLPLHPASVPTHPRPTATIGGREMERQDPEPCSVAPGTADGSKPAGAMFRYPATLPHQTRDPLPHQEAFPVRSEPPWRHSRGGGRPGRRSHGPDARTNSPRRFPAC